MQRKIETRISRETAGNFFEVVGVTWCCLTFWYNSGVPIGGDATWLGPFLPELSVVLPMCSVGVVLIAGGRLINKNLTPNLQRLLLAFVLLVVVEGNAIFSKNSQQSLVWLPVWAIGLLAIGCGDTFTLRSTGRRLIFVLGVAIGFFAVGLFPEKIPEPTLVAPLLGVAAAWGLAWFQAAPDREPWFAARLFLGWVAATTGIFGTWFLATLAVVLGHQLFDRKNRWYGSDLFLLLWIVGVGGWQWWHAGMDSVAAGWLPGFFENISQVWHGVGQGQFLTTMHEQANTLLPGTTAIPSGGVPLLLQEWGVAGTILVVGGVLLQSFKNWRWHVLLLAGILAAGAVLGSESGVVLLLVFATVRPQKFQRKKRSGVPRRTSVADAADRPAS